MTLEEFDKIIYNEYPNGDHSELYKNPDFTGYDATHIPRLSIIKMKLWDNGYATYTGEIKYKFNYHIYNTKEECIEAINSFEKDDREDRILTFGKYKGNKIIDIIKENPDYINWCWKNVKYFNLNHKEADILDNMLYNIQLLGSARACIDEWNNDYVSPLEGEQFVY